MCHAHASLTRGFEMKKNTAVAWMPSDDWVHNFPSAPSRSRGRPPKRWVRHSLRFHVHTLTNEIGGWQPKHLTYGYLQSQTLENIMKACEEQKVPHVLFVIEVTRMGEGKPESMYTATGFVQTYVASNKKFKPLHNEVQLWWHFASSSHGP